VPTTRFGRYCADMSWWTFWKKRRTKTSEASDNALPRMREDGFLFMDMPSSQRRNLPDYLEGVDPQDSPAPEQTSDYTAVDHAALASANKKRLRRLSLWEKLRSGDGLSVDDIPLQGVLGRTVHHLLMLSMKPLSLMADNIRVLIGVGLVLLGLSLASAVFTDWMRWMFSGLL
jgi:hypothetical protein